MVGRREPMVAPYIKGYKVTAIGGGRGGYEYKYLQVDRLSPIHGSWVTVLKGLYVRWRLGI